MTINKGTELLNVTIGDILKEWALYDKGSDQKS